MRSPIRNLTKIKYKNYSGKEELTLDGYYTGEIADVYSEDKYIKAVVHNKMGKVYNEQMGLLYEYSSTIQHNGKPVLDEGALVWIRNDHNQEADFIVKSVVPSLNSTLYHLVKKEV